MRPLWCTVTGGCFSTRPGWRGGLERSRVLSVMHAGVAVTGFILEDMSLGGIHAF